MSVHGWRSGSCCWSWGRVGKSGISHGKGEGRGVYAGVNSVCNACGCTHMSGCMVNGSFARAAFLVLFIIITHINTCGLISLKC